MSVATIFGEMSPDRIRALTHLINSICRMCKHKKQDVGEGYDKYDKHGNDDYDDYEDEEVYGGGFEPDFHYFARSLLEPADDNDTETSGVAEEKEGTEELTLDQIPSVIRTRRSANTTNEPLDQIQNGTSFRRSADDADQGKGEEPNPAQVETATRAKRSIDYYSYNQALNYGSQYMPPYGFHGYVQDSYFRHNPYYLYSKLAYIEHKLREKRQKRRKGGYKKKSKGKKKGYGKGQRRKSYKPDLSTYGVEHKH